MNGYSTTAPKRPAKARNRSSGKLLAAEEDDQMVEPGMPDCSDRAVVEVSRQIDPDNLGPERAGDRRI
jgi:hypothetical protein